MRYGSLGWYRVESDAVVLISPRGFIKCILYHVSKPKYIYILLAHIERVETINLLVMWGESYYLIIYFMYAMPTKTTCIIYFVIIYHITHYVVG